MREVPQNYRSCNRDGTYFFIYSCIYSEAATTGLFILFIYHSFFIIDHTRVVK